MPLILKRLLKYFIYFVSGAAILTAGLFAYLIWFQPAFYFPKPTGQYAVGVKTYHWIDANRKEVLGDDPAHPNRELMVNIWFPAPLKVGAANGKLVDKPTTPYVPYFVDYVKTHERLLWLLLPARPIFVWAESEALLSPEPAQFPVIIFSHGFGCIRDNNTANCEELASHGYVVVGISHTYDSYIVQYPDGRIVSSEKSMEKRFMDENKKNKKLEQCEPEVEQSAKIWIADVQFVLDQLEKLNGDEKSIFYKRFDQKNIGMFGHSFGGSTAIQMCRRDPRIKAGVDLDCPLLGPDATKKFDKPCMFMLSGITVKDDERPWTKDDWKKHEINSIEEEKKHKSKYLPAFEQIAKSNGQFVYTFVLKNAGHMAFSDDAIAKYVPLKIFTKLDLIDLGVGPIDGFRATEIVNAYLVNFFDKYLKGRSSQLLDGGKQVYPEVEARVCK